MYKLILTYQKTLPDTLFEIVQQSFLHDKDKIQTGVGLHFL